jgi:hypothetical protein
VGKLTGGGLWKPTRDAGRILAAALTEEQRRGRPKDRVGAKGEDGLARPLMLGLSMANGTKRHY